MLGQSLLLELVSAELDPKTGLEKVKVAGFAHRSRRKEGEIMYETDFKVPVHFGEVGAVLVENEHHKEMFLKDIVLDGLPYGSVHLSCNSWVHSKYDNPEKRVFFTNKKFCLSSKIDVICERLADDNMRDISIDTFGGFDRTGLFQLILMSKSRTKIQIRIYSINYQFRLKILLTDKSFLVGVISGDKFFWFRDEEFARQTLAGLNPYSLKLVTEWPLKSELDPEIYGPPESAITKEIIEQEIRGFPTVQEAIREKKLFILDYHDLFLPYVSKVRNIEGTTLYGSRTLFFLTREGTLRPLAIELTRPPMDGKPQWKQVFQPSWNATGVWLWRLAKAHVLAHDSGYHQLVSHWLRTHCVTEPYIIATNRQLSVLHPIYRLLHPHFRYTMEINALARESLINAGGIIESSFSPGKYSLEISAVAYGKEWRFDQEALPADLIRRGMAVEDPTAPHGLKLTIEDYPFANDGLLMWDAIKQWVTDYVNHYYPDSSVVQTDGELQAWWTEIKTVGHADKKDEPWWPELNTREDLIGIITTMVWVTSGHHAAVNFGQYVYAGYFPNRPTIARTNMPTEDPSPEFWKNFLKKPEVALLQCFPSQIQATRIMAVLDILSNHSPDEEYIGEKMEAAWAEEPVIKAAFERFKGRLLVIEGIIDDRNANSELKNRNGAGVVPYELLKPFSEPGVTGMGVPYSISI
ncbi:hypothetical protein GBA52_021877 [Prunus armeniaca]|nr:hypothetical protein GBA52_021877 [Prunus armeniaca]